jgi:NADPH:quinone reductase-like Zn-dependent oxidoreductase
LREAAAQHDGRTALGLIESIGPRAVEWVLVLGAAGGLGSLLVQLAHRVGARVIAAAPGESKLGLARNPGAASRRSLWRPGAVAPQILVGGNSDVAIRRVVRYGDGWAPSSLTLDALASGAAKQALLDR